MLTNTLKGFATICLQLIYKDELEVLILLMICVIEYVFQLI